jgi:putative methanogenesis marker protein 8
MGRHVIEALGKTKVVIEDGKIVEVGEPQLEYCPLFYKKRGIETMTPEIVRENIEFRIKDFGMCTPDRKLRMRDFLSFGVSELLGMAVAEGRLDAAVLVCDGTGTLVVSEPDLIQGIGGRISGIVETSPIDEVIDAVGRDRVLDQSTAKIDQLAGTELAFKLGFKKVGVTVSFAGDAKALRDRYGDRVAIFAVHSSGRTAEDAEVLFDSCDIVTACGSKSIRAVAKERAPMQAGNKVPVYAASKWGEELIEHRRKVVKAPQVIQPEDPPRPLI